MCTIVLVFRNFFHWGRFGLNNSRPHDVNRMKMIMVNGEKPVQFTSIQQVDSRS